MRRVLILGNGKSRLDYRDFIKNWTGEIWGCNRVFLELVTGDLPHLNRLIGDVVALKLALEYKQKNNETFEIYVRKDFHASQLNDNNIKVVTVPEIYVKDSGTTFVVQALIEGYDEIVLVGFDLGGPDIYITNHELKNKRVWVDRWKKIANDFGLDKITFMGTNHKKFILSGTSSSYAKKYIKGKNHLDTILKRKDSVLILGNGTSRLKYIEFINNWKGEIWVCTRGYEEYKELPRIDRVGSVHASALIKAYLCKINNNLDYHIFSSKIIKRYENVIHVFDNVQGWATGPLMVQQALIEKYDDIQLLGFDFGGSDIYQDHFLYGGNFIKQFKLIYKLYPNKVNIHFVGKNPGFLRDL